MRLSHLALLGAGLLAAGPALAAGDPREAEANRAFVEYPKESLQRGEQGAVGYRVKIDRRGNPLSCEITQSSGFERLDLATCAMLMERARFTPKREGTRAERQTYDGRVVWRIG
ncbi:MAG: energy transducer TonB [Allosphingosinicella sp.]